MVQIRDSMAFLKDEPPQLYTYLDTWSEFHDPGETAPPVRPSRGYIPAAPPDHPPAAQRTQARHVPTFPSHSPCSMPGSGSTAATRI